MRRKADHPLCILLFFCLIFSAAFPLSVAAEPPPKDPYFAAALSWFVPGLGQFYIDQPLKGTLFWITDTALFWGTILTIADLDLKLNSDVGFSFAIRLKKNPSSERILATVGLGVAYVAFHIYNMIDAADGALKYNDQIYRQRLKREGVSFLAGPAFQGLSYSWGF